MNDQQGPSACPQVVYSLVGETPLSSATRRVAITGMLKECLPLKYKGGHLSLEFKEPLGSSVCWPKGQLSRDLEVGPCGLTWEQLLLLCLWGGL